MFFFVTTSLAKGLKLADLTGFALTAAEVSASEEFEEMQSETQLPVLQWLQITAVSPEEADFRLTSDHRLEVTERALALLRTFRIEHAVIE